MRYLLLILILLSSCKTERISDKQESAVVRAPSAQADKMIAGAENNEVISDSINIQTSAFHLTDNQIAVNPFESDFETMLRSIREYEIDKESKENIHVENQIDTILTVRFDNSSIQYFKGKPNSFILGAKIKTAKINFKRSIKIGMSKAHFFQLFAELTSEDVNKVTITDLEGLQTVDFIFVDDKLFEVQFHGYID
jgi:hypothetical protein